MLVESLESRNLLAGDNSQSEYADLATSFLEGVGEILGTAAVGGATAVAGGAASYYVLPPAVGALGGGICGAYMGARIGALTGAGIAVAGDLIEVGTDAISGMIEAIYSVDDDNAPQDACVMEQGNEAWISSYNVNKGAVSGADWGLQLGAIGGAIMGSLTAVNAVSWDMSTPNAQARFFLGAGVGAGLMVMRLV